MRLVIQRVTNAQVEIDNIIVGKIGKGLLLLIGVGKNDTKETVDYLVQKMCKLRIFPDENDKMNLSVKDIGGEILNVSQFTLYADCEHGNRPSFFNSAEPIIANELYEYFNEKCKQTGLNVQCGVFGAYMKISLLNDGPVTIVLEK